VAYRHSSFAHADGNWCYRPVRPLSSTTSAALDRWNLCRSNPGADPAQDQRGWPTAALALEISPGSWPIERATPGGFLSWLPAFAATDAAGCCQRHSVKVLARSCSFSPEPGSTAWRAETEGLCSLVAMPFAALRDFLWNSGMCWCCCFHRGQGSGPAWPQGSGSTWLLHVCHGTNDWPHCCPPVSAPKLEQSRKHLLDPAPQTIAPLRT